MLLFALEPGHLYSANKSAHPVELYGWGSAPLALPDGGTCFGIVTEGAAELTLAQGTMQLGAGMFFVAPRGGGIRGGRGLVIFRPGYRGLAQVGGPLEATGRLRYIDGCTDTLWVCPPRLGEPCLNHLHIPPGTNQTRHTHPSDRIGVILGGRGTCVTPSKEYPLRPGLGWLIPAGAAHSFRTTDAALDVVAWHPDSDFGPRDQDHPMLNRTIIP
jgi:quercetin dioxygenase-like cupin family protein